MTHGDVLYSVLYIAFSLVAIFGSLTFLWIKRRRAARKAQVRERMIEALMRSLPVPPRAASHVIRIRGGRVERVRLEREEPSTQVDPASAALLVNAILNPGRSTPVEEPFEGKGGESGGAGASGDWLPPAPTAEELHEADRRATILETSENQIETPEPESPSAESGTNE